MFRRSTIVVLAIVGACASSLASAACAIDADAMAFGQYRPLDTQHVDSLSRIQVTCDGEAGTQVLYRVRLNEGTGGSFQPRAMVQGAQRLQYNVFKNAARSQVWGDGSAGTEVIADSLTLQGVGELVSRDHVAFARLFARQAVRPGTFSDTIQITLETCDTPQQCQVVMTVPLRIG